MLDPSSLNGNLLLSMIKPRLIEFTALAYISLETEQQQKGLSDVKWFHGCLDKMFSVRSYWPGLSETSRWFLTFERGPGYSQHCSQMGQCPLGPGKEHIIKAQQMGGWKIKKIENCMTGNSFRSIPVQCACWVGKVLRNILNWNITQTTWTMNMSLLVYYGLNILPVIRIIALHRKFFPSEVLRQRQ